MKSLNQEISRKWFALVPTVLGAIFWIGLLWAASIGDKGFIAGLGSPFGELTIITCLIAPISGLAYGILAISDIKRYPVIFLSGLLIGVSPLLFFIVA